MDDAPKGPVILWLDYGSEGWVPFDFPTVKDALEAPERGWCTNWIITRPVAYDIVEHPEPDKE